MGHLKMFRFHQLGHSAQKLGSLAVGDPERFGSRESSQAAKLGRPFGKRDQVDRSAVRLKLLSKPLGNRRVFQGDEGDAAACPRKMAQELVGSHADGRGNIRRDKEQPHGVSTSV